MCKNSPQSAGKIRRKLPHIIQSVKKYKVSVIVSCIRYGYAFSYMHQCKKHQYHRKQNIYGTIPYFVIHGDFDKQVDKSHSDRMVEKLRNLGKSVQYMEVAKMGHGGINMPLSVKEKMVKFIVSLI
jgi:acetyl esterase/lipase